MWLAIGLIGQTLFTARFALQWIMSERAGKSVTPKGFWYLSMGGSFMLLMYALHRRDPVFTLGQAFGSFVYFRNLVLVEREEQRARAGAPDDDAVAVS